MKAPKKLVELLNKKQAFIDESRGRLEKDVVNLQSKLLNKLIAEIVPELDIKDGIIQDSEKNYRLLSSLDKAYNQFIKTASSVIIPEMAKTTEEIAALNKLYFERANFKTMGQRFEEVIQATSRKIDLRLGLKGGQSVSGGFIDSVVKDKALATELKNFTSKSIAGQVDMKQYIQGLSDLVNGIPKEVIKDGKKVITQTGGLEKQYQRYAYDLYQQYDRAYSVSLADEFEMKYFIYQGGLISDSRDFCAAHNNRVWSREEAEEWVKWMPYMGTYPENYEVKAKDLYEIPSYLSYAGYTPLVDAGGYRCRHSIGYISDELAFELRPELKGSE